jgi:hypothetical protein
MVDLRSLPAPEPGLEALYELLDAYSAEMLTSVLKKSTRGMIGPIVFLVVLALTGTTVAVGTSFGDWKFFPSSIPNALSFALIGLISLVFFPLLAKAAKPLVHNGLERVKLLPDPVTASFLSTNEAGPMPGSRFWVFWLVRKLFSEAH